MFIFLDIDGVMLPAKSWESPVLLPDGFPAFQEDAVTVLQQFIANDTTILLTTSHKSRFSIPQWIQIFHERKLMIQNLVCLDENIQQLSRKDEILNWFQHHTVPDHFIILDDDKSLNALPPHLKRRLMLTSSYIGLRLEHVDEIKQMLLSELVIA
jgi:hypothetical protein